MFFKLFILFALIPVIELAILIKVGSIIGIGYTILLVIGTAMIGAYLVRLEGLNIMLRFQKNISEGIFPAEEIFFPDYFYFPVFILFLNNAGKIK